MWETKLADWNIAPGKGMCCSALKGLLGKSSGAGGITPGSARPSPQLPGKPITAVLWVFLLRFSVLSPISPHV